MENDSKVDPPVDTKDPGAAQYGNFMNYYSFNSAEHRLNLMPTHIWKKENEEIKASGNANEGPDSTFIVLDVGCNAGNFTQLLYNFLTTHTQKNVFIYGIDLDPILINRAIEHNKHKENITYGCIDIMNLDSSNKLSKHLQRFNKSQFDAVFCLSLTMWIHLNHADEGLLAFLRKVHELSRLLIIEPQPWKCYSAAVRRAKKAGKGFPLFDNLKMRKTIESDIRKFLESACGLQKLYQTEPTKWDRKIAFYVRD